MNTTFKEAYRTVEGRTTNYWRRNVALLRRSSALLTEIRFIVAMVFLQIWCAYFWYCYPARKKEPFKNIACENLVHFKDLTYGAHYEDVNSFQTFVQKQTCNKVSCSEFHSHVSNLYKSNLQHQHLEYFEDLTLVFQCLWVRLTTICLGHIFSHKDIPNVKHWYASE